MNQCLNLKTTRVMEICNKIGGINLQQKSLTLPSTRLFTNRDLFILFVPLIIEQGLEYLVGLADSIMVAQVAHTMGAEVTVLSQTMNKKEEAFGFGADQYYATSDPATFTELAGHFDLILNTVSVNINFDAYLSTLNVDGTLVNVGLPNKPDQFNVFSLFAGRRSIAASNVGGIRETQEMLDFSAEHGIDPMIEVINADQVDEAYERVLRSDVRYRFVIDMSTL
jgi:alcohol dehydrogenase (NADP+)